MSNVKKNFAYQSLYQILVIILPLITSPYISRILGAELIGIYSFTFSIADYFVLFAMLGINNYGNRECASVRDDKDKLEEIFSSIYTLHFIISLMVIIVYIGYLLILNPNDFCIALIQGIYVVSTLFDINWFYFGIEKFKLTVTRNIIIKLSMVLMIFIFIENRGDLWKYALIMSSGVFISQLVMWIPLKKYVTFKFVGFNKCKKHIIPLLILFVPLVAVSLYKIMDKIMLGYIVDKIQVGLYENAEKAINIPISIITAFGTVMMPQMANLVGKGDYDSSKKYISISMEVVACLAVGMSFGIAGISHEFAIIFWGNEFAECGMTILILSLSIIFWSCANVIRTQYLIPAKKDKIFIVSVIVGAITNLIINLVLIPKLHAKGAAIGTVLAEIAVCIVQIGYVWTEMPFLIYLKEIIYFFPLGIIMFIVVKFIGIRLGLYWYTILIQVIMGAYLYGSMCLILSYHRRESYIWSIFEKWIMLMKIKK